MYHHHPPPRARGLAGGAAFATAAAGDGRGGAARLTARTVTAGGADRARVAALLARAFADDPALAFIIPDPRERARRLPRLFALMFDSDGRAGMRLLTTGGEATALWRGPGQARIGRLEMLRQAWPMWRAFGGNLSRALAVGDAIDAHLPSGDFWYLHLAACDPAHQGRGWGGEAVRGGLARVGDRLPVCLETATKRNLSFYAALGFRVTDEWRVSNGPRFWSMQRG